MNSDARQDVLRAAMGSLLKKQGQSRLKAINALLHDGGHAPATHEELRPLLASNGEILQEVRRRQVGAA